MGNIEKLKILYEKDWHINFVLIVFLLSLPFSKGVSSTAMVVLLIFSLLKINKKSFVVLLKTYKSVIFLSLFFFIYVFGLFYSENLNHGFRFIFKQNDFIVIPLIVIINSHLINNNFSKYLKFFIFGVTVASLITLLLFALPEEKIGWIVKNFHVFRPYHFGQNKIRFGLYSPFIDRLQFSYLIAMAIISQFWIFIKGRFKLQDIFILIIPFSLLLLLGARGAQLGFLFVIILWGSYIFYKKFFSFLVKRIGRRTSVILLITGILVIIIFLPVLSYKAIPSVRLRYSQLFWELDLYKSGEYKKHDYQYFTSINRILSWKNSIEIIKENPILGVGTGDIQSEMEKTYKKNNDDVVVHFHNQYLQIWMAAGIAGLLVFLFILIYWINSQFKKKDKDLMIFSFSFLIFYIIVLMFGIPLNFQVGGMTFAIFFSLLGIKK